MPSRPPTLLIVDDEPGMLRLVERMTAESGFRVISYGAGKETLAQLQHQRSDAALVDLCMPEVGGLDVLRAIRTADPHCQVILMTGEATVDSAIEAVKLGALDYLSKPLDWDRLSRLLAQVREDIERRSAVFAAEQHTAKRLEVCGMIGRSPAMQDVLALIRRISRHARSALVTGETGTGKELAARALHQLGPRSSRRFVAVNCSAVVETLFESELFGHVRGAFTGATEHKAGLFEAADGGTLFLDEIGELPLGVQAKLLRTLESGEVQRVGSLQPKNVDVRIIAATNRNLHEHVAAGRFRSDLLYRLNVVEISLPPLRERREDIPYLIAAFVSVFSQQFERRIEGLSSAAEQLLISQPWPGNVRELRNVIERACMLAEGAVLTEADIARALGAVVRSPPAIPAPAGTQLNALKQAELEQIQRAIAESGGNKAAAARKLGVNRRLLYRRLRQVHSAGM